MLNERNDHLDETTRGMERGREGEGEGEGERERERERKKERETREREREVEGNKSSRGRKHQLGPYREWREHW